MKQAKEAIKCAVDVLLFRIRNGPAVARLGGLLTPRGIVHSEMGNPIDQPPTFKNLTPHLFAAPRI